MRRYLEEFYWAVQRRVVPGLRDSQYVYVDALTSQVKSGDTWLDLGCGHQVFPAWTNTDEAKITARAGVVIGLDRFEESVKAHKSIQLRVVGDIGALPFREGAFDLISANMVVEHLHSPEENLREIKRVLKPGGSFLFHTINRKHYHARIASLLPERLRVALVGFLEGRNAEDVFPTHYRMNTRDAISRLANMCGLHQRELRMLNSSAATIMLGPIVILELLVIRLLGSSALADWRRNIVAILEKPVGAGDYTTAGLTAVVKGNRQTLPYRHNYGNVSKCSTPGGTRLDVPHPHVESTTPGAQTADYIA